MRPLYIIKSQKSSLRAVCKGDVLYNFYNTFLYTMHNKSHFSVFYRCMSVHLLNCKLFVNENIRSEICKVIFFTQVKRRNEQILSSRLKCQTVKL